MDSPSSGKSHFRFLDLPPEIRDQVYSELFSAPKAKREYADQPSRYVFDLRLLRTSKQIYKEARQIFRLKNLFASIETPWQQAEGFVMSQGGVPIVANGLAADNFEPCHIRAIIGTQDMEPAATVKFILSVDDIEAFCWTWFYSNLTYLDMNRHLCLNLVLANHQAPGEPLPQAVQRRLTEPFGLIKQLGHFDITGDIDGDTEERLRKSQSIPFDTPLECLEKSLHLLGVGDAQLKAEKCHEAIESYTKAFHAIHIVVGARQRWIHARDYFKPSLPVPLFGTKNAEYVHVTMRIKLVASTMLAYLKLEDWEEAHFWGMRSITLGRQELGEGADVPAYPQFPAAREWGQIFHRTAIAAEQLGNLAQARDMYRIATAWLPADVGLQADVRRMSMR